MAVNLIETSSWLSERVFDFARCMLQQLVTLHLKLPKPTIRTITLLTTLSLSTALPASAAKIYKYLDENGNLAFSDRPVAKGELIQVKQAVPSVNQHYFSVEKTGPKDDLTLLAINDYFGPVEVEFRLDQSQNMLVNYNLPHRFIINPRSKEETIRLWRNNPRLGYSYTYTHSFVFGDPRAKHQPQEPYLLPISTKDAGAFRITQAFNGNRSHTDPQSQYAVDFAIPEGTNIYAARSGVVMDVANDFIGSGRTEKDKQRANYVRILHDDGTMALYAHLKLESVQFAVGLRVERGQLIGKSGNTGYSTGPHLHFAIQKNYGMLLRSLPFEFEGRNRQPFGPEEGMIIGKMKTTEYNPMNRIGQQGTHFAD